MDRDLRIRMLLEAGDRATRPLRDIAAGGSRAAEALRATRDRLKEIERAQVDVAAFRQLKAGARSTEQAMQAATTRVGQLTREMAQADKPTRAMTRDLAAARAEAARLTRQHEGESRQLQELRDRLRAAGVETTSLARHERDLRRAAESTTRELEQQSRRAEQLADRQRRAGAARASFGRVQGMAGNMAASGVAAIGTGMAIGSGVWAGVKAAQEYESVMTDIAQKADLPRAKAVEMGKALLVASKAANQLPEALQAGVDTLAGFGLSPEKAVAMMTPIGRAATAYKAEIADLSAAAFAANDNLKVPVEQTARVIDIMAAAGKAGAFEVKDMAGAFPALTAGYQALGQSGAGAVADLSAALQIARKGAGDSATAATNVANIIQKISSPATIKAFSKFGIDLPAALKRAYAEGKSPLEAIAELTKKATGGDLGKIGFLFEDAQVQQGLRPLIQNLDEYRKIRADALGAKGVTDTDFAERLKDSAEQTKQLKINAMALAIGLGGALLPTVNAVTGKLASFASWISGVAQRHPTMTKAIVIGAAALAGLFVVLGGGAFAIAAILGPFAMLSAIATYTGMAMLPLIGIAAGVVLGIAAIAAGAYLIYANWGAIGAWFGGLWAEIKAGFSGGIAGIAGVLINFSPLGLLYRGFAALVNWLGGSMPTRLTDAGRWLIQGLINGITGMLGALKNAVVNAASSAAGWFKQKLGIRSPSRVFLGFGGYMMEGLGNGIDGGSRDVVRRVGGVARRLVATLAGTSLAVPAMATPPPALRLAEAAAERPPRPLTVPLAFRDTRPLPFAPAQRLPVPPMMAQPSTFVQQIEAGATTMRSAIDPNRRTRVVVAREDRRGPPPAPAAAPRLAEYHFHITQAPGQSAEDLARAIGDELDRRERRAAVAARSTYRDDPDGADV